MNCTICGFDNPAESRFCKKCGAALITPGGVPVPPAAASAAPAQAAATDAAAAMAGNEPARKVPLAPFVILAVILLIAAFAAFKMLGLDKASDTSVAATESAPAVTAPAVPPTAETPVVVAEPPKTDAMPTPAAEARAPAPADAPVEAAKDAALAATKTPAKAVPHKAPAKAPPAPSVQATQPSRAAAQSAAVVAAPAARTKDRWEEMLDTIASRCGKETFLNKVICEQRVRTQYCDGYWGKAAQCPMGMRDADKGQ